MLTRTDKALQEYEDTVTQLDMIVAPTYRAKHFTFPVDDVILEPFQKYSSMMD